MEKSNHRVLLSFIVLLIIGLCGLVGYLMLDKSDMKLSSNSTTNLKIDNFNIDITTSDNDKVISIDKTNIKVSGTFDDTTKEYKYNLNIKNKGTIGAYLYSVVSDDADLEVKVLDNDSELSQDKILKTNDELNVVLVVKAKDDASINFDTNIKLVFNQYDN